MIGTINNVMPLASRAFEVLLDNGTQTYFYMNEIAQA
jgi:hypothetical protein